MLNNNLSYKEQNSPNLMLIKPTLDYLEKCQHCKIDWTTSLPIEKISEAARLSAIDSLSRDSLHTYFNNMLDENILDGIVEYFSQSSIHCNKEDIKIRYTAFDIIKDFYAVLDPKKTCLLLVAPTFGYYIYQAEQYDITTKIIYAKRSNDFKVTPEELDKAFSDYRPNIFIFTNPVNPTGVYYNTKELEALAKVILKHKVFVISDEIFSDIYFEKEKPASMAAVKDMQNQTLTLRGLGKARGVRLSFACGKVPQIPRLPISGILKPIQAAAVSILENTAHNRNLLANSMAEYVLRIHWVQSRIDQMNQEFNQHYSTDHIIYIKPFILPKATNVFLIAFPGFANGIYGINAENKIKSSLDLAEYLFKASQVATIPGEGFFIDGTEMVLRIPLSIPIKELETGFELITQSLKEIIFMVK